MGFSKIKLSLALFAVIATVWGCGDLVQEDDATSGCNNALNDRDYDTAISKCSSNKEKAAAYLGKAGYDIINVLDASENSATANTTEDVVALLGAETVTYVFTLKTLKLSPSDIADDATRLTAIETAKENLEEVLDIYEDETSKTAEEIILETFAAAFATSLEVVIILDRGNALDTSSNLITNYVISSDSTIPSGDLSRSTLTDGSSVDTVMEKYDGRLWANEQTMSLYPQANHGNLENICLSMARTVKDAETPGRGLVTLGARLATIAAEFSALLSGDSSDTTESIDEIDSAIASLQSTIQPVCDAL